MPKANNKLIEANLNIQKLVLKALKDRKINAKIGFDILNKIKTDNQVVTDSSINMNSEHKLEWLKMSFENAKATMETLNKQTMMVYKSTLKSIDNQLDKFNEELEKINKKLEDAEGKEKKRLEEEKERVGNQ